MNCIKVENEVSRQQILPFWTPDSKDPLLKVQDFVILAVLDFGSQRTPTPTSLTKWDFDILAVLGPG